MQCVASMEKRRCLIRRAGGTSKVQEVVGYYTGGVYCSEKLRRNGIATAMMLRLLGPPTGNKDARHALPFAKVYDFEEQYLPQVSGLLSVIYARY